jgi:hypothetical protein
MSHAAMRRRIAAGDTVELAVALMAFAHGRRGKGAPASTASGKDRQPPLRLGCKIKALKRSRHSARVDQ